MLKCVNTVSAGTDPALSLRRWSRSKNILRKQSTYIQETQHRPNSVLNFWKSSSCDETWNPTELFSDFFSVTQGRFLFEQSRLQQPHLTVFKNIRFSHVKSDFHLRNGTLHTALLSCGHVSKINEFWYDFMSHHRIPLICFNLTLISL